MTHASALCRRHVSLSGFTLIEIMVVVVILGLLATMVATNVIQSAEVARREKAGVDCAQIAAAAKMFFIQKGRVPSIEDLTRRERGLSYLEDVPKDPWGGDYVLLAEGDPPDFEVQSGGRNRQAGDDDDVSSKRAGD